MGEFVIVVPLNDPEAVLISKLAAAMKLDLLTSTQSHGASIDRSDRLARKLTNGPWKQIVIVEMPGPKLEAKLKKQGRKVEIIDHHNYTGLRRAQDKNGRVKRSSLEQFLKRFRLTDTKIAQLGFDPKLVRGIGVMDRGFVWQARKEKYSWPTIKKIMAYQDELLSEVRDWQLEKEKIAAAEKVWAAREKRNEFYLLKNKTNLGLRSRLSRIIAFAMKKPTPIILNEPKRGFIYIQETDRAQDLFKHFGGFTFGMGTNWGYRNEPGKKPVHLEEVLKFLD